MFYYSKLEVARTMTGPCGTNGEVEFRVKCQILHGPDQMMAFVVDRRGTVSVTCCVRSRWDMGTCWRRQRPSDQDTVW